MARIVRDLGWKAEIGGGSREKRRTCALKELEFLL
jgi:hypothetical protein